MIISGSDNLPFRTVCPWEVRDRFNQLGIVDLMRAGKLRMRQTYLNDPNPSYKQPRGTKSQAIEWLTLEKAVLVARVHRYRQPGYNTTKYDPKYLLDWERGEILRPVSVRAGNHLCGYCYERGNIANWNPGIDQAIEQQK